MSTDLHTLSGAYALNALSPGETEAFDRHLEDCPSCREEVHEFRQVAGLMGAAEWSRPPSALKVRVLAAADQQAQLRPLVTPIGSAPSRRWTSRIGGKVVGAAAAVVLVAGGATILTRGGDEPQQVQATSVSEVFSAPDVHVKTIRTRDGRPLRVASSPDSGQLAVATDSLRQLSGKKVYQMWTVHNDRATSAGVITNLDAGKVMAIPTFGTTVAITVEPAGGSRRPTSEPIVTLDPQSV